MVIVLRGKEEQRPFLARGGEANQREMKTVDANGKKEIAQGKMKRIETTRVANAFKQRMFILDFYYAVNVCLPSFSCSAHWDAESAF